uniref:HECT-type E3 ubiquitin transferase n=2 Tax=Grammatophora oceanica TaxID=210454 RepID=A0A7S1UN23_9STRA|mmetsp:Transcript_12805/g.18893  ORF Transcript_12805/g.18893 Transcript_12805/m.18893 type:complete len:769 (+) Transcript_12805:521-2827(+)|eukprot:CAMPEP_0194050536 /NCGR_PEP_ID=MMETSP0009_2-20130614/35821_1 /TAXON_ID=210454 /ORGANISM="Grammatophora oceanica, Strain CCMP 410" /LENGTH=768 /DNA_ID=CAMNT_0038697229 /DNA_START=456 /DNA_END=2762 /DNA_ORIENTATION=+
MPLFGKRSKKSSADKDASTAASGESSGGGGARATSGPGAMSVGGGATVFRVTVPDNVRPGEEFQVYAGSRIVRVRCPPDSRPGQSLQITVPPDPNPGSGGGSSSSTRAPMGGSSSSAGGGGGAMPPDSPNVRRINDPNNRSGHAAYMVTIPEGVRGGQQFPVTIQGQQLMVTCPQNARPGMSVRIVPPPPPSGTDITRGPQGPAGGGGGAPQQKKDEKTQLFEVEVPRGVQPGQPFALLAGGVRVLVTCPTNANPGQRIRFKLPLALTQKPKATNEAAAIKLSYDKDGWQRTIRVSDMKFQWVRVDDKGDIDTRTRFHIEKSAYVRKLEFRPGDDPRIRTGILRLVPASDAVVDSRIKSADNRDLVTYSDIANAQVKAFEEKAQWFQDTCAQLCVEWNEGHMRMNVRRQFLLGDSVDAVMSLSRKDLRKLWRFEFIGEMGIDAGGLAREWFQLVTEEIFDPDMGLWQSSAVNQMCMEINPASEYCCEDHLVYYRFLGRVMGKALFDRQLVAGHMVQHLYKHILGWPVTFADLEMVDEEYFNNLKQLQTMNKNGDDISMLCLDFTTTQEVMGTKSEIELVPGGADMEVNNDNFPEYLEACLKYRMLDRVKPQMNELLLGFFDVIPEPLLTIFDFQELELLMCGLPEIDMADWKEHTEYSGEYDEIGPDHQSCQWFWEIVTEFDQEMKARLLQFVTGTSGVPSRGFGVLQGNDGNIRKFTVHGVQTGVCLYPRAHTCFNRIDLPMYETREECQEKLKLAVTMVATGFDIE